MAGGLSNTLGMKELGELWGKESRNPISANTGKGTPLSVVVSLIDSHTGSFWVLFQAGISLARCFWKKLGEEQGPNEALQPITKPTEGDVGSNCMHSKRSHHPTHWEQAP